MKITCDRCFNYRVNFSPDIWNSRMNYWCVPCAYQYKYTINIVIGVLFS